jgi:hypothetical protein
LARSSDSRQHGARPHLGACRSPARGLTCEMSPWGNHTAPGQSPRRVLALRASASKRSPFILQIGNRVSTTRGRVPSAPAVHERRSNALRVARPRRAPRDPDRVTPSFVYARPAVHRSLPASDHASGTRRGSRRSSWSTPPVFILATVRAPWWVRRAATQRGREPPRRGRGPRGREPGVRAGREVVTCWRDLSRDDHREAAGRRLLLYLDGADLGGTRPGCGAGGVGVHRHRRAAARATTETPSSTRSVISGGAD